MDGLDRSTKPKLSLLRLAEKLGSVTRACETLGYSRDSYYRFKALYDRGGLDALRDITRRKPVFKNRVSINIERAVLDASLAHPSWGQQRIAAALLEDGVKVSSSGVRSIWMRSGVETFDKRVYAILAKIQQDGFPPSPEQQAAIERARALGRLKSGKLLERPGMIVYHDIVRMGEHPALGSIHVMSVVDAYSRVAYADVASDVAGLDAIALIRDQVVSHFALYGVKIQTVRTDRRMPFIDNGRAGYKTWLRSVSIDHTYRLTKTRGRLDAGQDFITLMSREVFQPMFRGKSAITIDHVRDILQAWLTNYNTQRSHPGPACYGKTPERTLKESSSFLVGRSRF